MPRLKQAVVADGGGLCQIGHMRAKLVFRSKDVFPDGHILEIRIWQLPAATPERPHGLKYLLFYGRRGERIVAYDNEAVKGDHRHYRDRQLPYEVVDIARLMTDFLTDVARERKWKWRS